MRRLAFLSVFASLSLTLAACGDGGGGVDAPAGNDAQGNSDASVPTDGPRSDGPRADAQAADAPLADAAPADAITWPDAGPNELTDLGCRSIASCFSCCTPSDGYCMQACIHAGSANAQAELAVWQACVETNCMAECGTSATACSACDAEHCQAAHTACGYEGQGTDTCSSFRSCMEVGYTPLENAGGADVCLDKSQNQSLAWIEYCAGYASQAALDTYVAWIDCVHTRCTTECTTSQEACNSCAFDTTCAVENAACTN